MNLLGLLFSVAVILLTFAFLLRHSFGFGLGTTLSHDNVLLSSERYMLRGKPDRLVQRGKRVIPEEKKPGRFLSESYRVQLGVYLLLVEEHYGVRPPHGFVILGSGERVKVKNTRKLRQHVTDIADRIREARMHVEQPLSPPRTKKKCVACGQRKNCDQRLA